MYMVSYIAVSCCPIPFFSLAIDDYIRTTCPGLDLCFSGKWMFIFDRQGELHVPFCCLQG